MESPCKCGCHRVICKLVCYQIRLYKVDLLSVLMWKIIRMRLLFMVTAVFWWPGLANSAIPIIERHQLECGNGFPCPEEIQRRVDFWIHVFRSWGTDQIVFHDSEHPERTYSVIVTEHACRRRRAGQDVESERRRIRNHLNAIAHKLGQRNPKFTATEKAFLALFPGRDGKAIQRAGQNIRCQQGNRDRFLGALERYGAYRAHVLKVLKQSGLSEDILYLPFVESAYNPQAYSWAGAAGLWQIMPRTARKLGLQLNATVDERFDPEAATRAAARYLSNSTNVLMEAARKKNPNISISEVNPFIITSYNYGVAGMRRAIDRIGPDYVDVLNKYRSRSFRVAVKNFYASFLAARYVARNADEYFELPDVAPEHRYAALVLKNPTSVKRIEKVFGVDQETLKRLNPSLTRYVWKGWRLVPDGFTLRLPYRKDQWQRQVAYLEKLKPEQPGLSGTKYVVQRGDTACGVARIFSVSCRDLVQVNNLGRNALIRVGQKLDIPGKPAKQKPVQVAAATTSRAAMEKQQKTVVAKASTEAPMAQQQASWQVVQKPAETQPPVLAKKETTVAAASVSVSVSSDAQPSVEDKPELQAKEVFKALLESIKVGVHVGQANGKTVFSILVEPEETLGHYADWLGHRGTGELRRLNGIKHSRNLRIGQRLILPIPNQEKREAFEADRSEYHRTLVDEFQQHYEILDVEYYVIKKGDSIWRVASASEVPYWVVTRLNPDKVTPAIGERLVLPVSKARKPAQEAPVHHSDSG